MKDVISGLHRLEREVLPFVGKSSAVEDIVKNSGMEEVEVVRAIRWLSDKKLCELTELEEEVVDLEANGHAYRKEGLPERRFLEALEKGSMDLGSLSVSARITREEASVSIGVLKRKDWIKIIKGKDVAFEITGKGRRKLEEGFGEEEFLKGNFPVKSGDLTAEQKGMAEDLKKRKAIVKTFLKKTLTASLTPEGRAAAGSGQLKEKVVDRLTAEMIKSGGWKSANLREYNIQAKVPRMFFGKKQPYRRFLEDVRNKLVAMGFTEMDGPIVESEFWNMDALFMPQFHSARDIHDAYYVREPKYAKDLPQEIVRKVKKAHEKGIPGSRGWGYEFDGRKTARLILRSHDTAISSRTLASKDLKMPGKYFQISRCFRYDVIDATHNADFDQIGGFVVDDGLNLRHLFGLLRLFARTFCRTDEIKVVPSYFPFTEPSAGLYAKHKEIGWVELAGAGIFRPEMCLPLGVDRPVIAWGIGLSRVAMFRLGLKDIRMLYSHDLKYLRNARVV